MKEKAKKFLKKLLKVLLALLVLALVCCCTYLVYTHREPIRAALRGKKPGKCTRKCLCRKK